MEAIVLVGGEGTRLRPLTYELPKQMLPVVDRPMVEHVVGWLANNGVSRVVCSLGYRPSSFTEAYPTGEIAGVPVFFAVEPELLDTAGAVRFAATAAEVRGPFFVLNGDVLSDFELRRLVELHEARQALATIELVAVEDPSSFGVVVTDEEQKVSEFVEKPPAGSAPSNLVNAGCYLLDPSVVEMIPEGRRVSIERETFPALVEKGALYALSSDSYWLDTGTPAQFLRASLDVLSGSRTSYALPSAPEVRPGVYSADPREETAGLDRSYIGAAACLGTGARLSCSVVSAGAEVASGARLDRAIVMAGAYVGERSVVEDSIVGPGARLGRDCYLRAFCVVGPGAVVKDGSVLAGERVERR